jgi:hypothetical protein
MNLSLGKETFYQSTRRHRPEDWPFHQHRYKSLKSRTFIAGNQWINIKALTTLLSPT